MKMREARILMIFFSLFAPFSGKVHASKLSESDKKLWILCIKRVKMKPPCCGACKLLTQEDAKGLWEYLTSNSPEKRSGKNQALWKEHQEKLLEEFKQLNPERYQELYGNQDLSQKRVNKGENRP